MKKITEQEIQAYVSEVGEFDKEHHKYSSFYCTATHTFDETDIKDLAEDEIDASAFLGVQVTVNGIWDDSYGCEWDDITYHKVENYEEVIPEVIIPEHTVTKQRYAAFKPEFKE